MSPARSLRFLIDRDMSDLIEKYGLSVVEIDEKEIFLLSTNFSIRVLADRNGVSMIYFDTTHKPINGYNILLFLINRRRNRLTISSAKSENYAYDAFIEDELISLISHLRRAGQDILDGYNEWIAEYSWPTINAPSSLVELIDRKKGHRKQSKQSE